MIVFCTIIYFLKFETFPVCCFSPREKGIFIFLKVILHLHVTAIRICWKCNIKIEKSMTKCRRPFSDVEPILQATLYPSIFSNNCQNAREKSSKHILLNSSRTINFDFEHVCNVARSSSVSKNDSKYIARPPEMSCLA